MPLYNTRTHMMMIDGGYFQFQLALNDFLVFCDNQKKFNIVRVSRTSQLADFNLNLSVPSPMC